jgi:hypothetical protein
MTTSGEPSRSNPANPEAWAGELRVNLIRLVAIALFYGRHLIEWALAERSAPIRGQYHVTVTLVVIAWCFEAAVLHVWLLSRRYDPWLKYFAVLWDAIMIVFLCVVAGGPRTPLLLLFFALIASAPLRLSIGLVYAATTAAMLGYLFVLGHYAWYKVGFHRYYASPELRIPRNQEAITLLAMLVCGLFAGQVVRQMRRLTGGQTAEISSEEPA